MRELNTYEVNAVSGALLSGDTVKVLTQGVFALACIGIVGGFALGAASVYAFQYIKSLNS